MIVIDTCIVFHLFNETSLNLKAQKLIEKSPPTLTVDLQITGN